jgi:hypothetical protein
MKGKGKLQSGKNPDKSLGGDFYAGGSSNVAAEAKNKSEGFKRGGKTVKMSGDKAKADMGRKPRMSGGKVMSSASGPGTMRAKSSHY